VLRWHLKFSTLFNEVRRLPDMPHRASIFPVETMSPPKNQRTAGIMGIDGWRSKDFVCGLRAGNLIELNVMTKICSVTSFDPNKQRPNKSTIASTSEKNMAKKKDKLGRNAPCPCGSGKKFKKCCMDKDGAFKSAALAPINTRYHDLERRHAEHVQEFMFFLDEMELEENKYLHLNLPIETSEELLLGLIQEHSLTTSRMLIEHLKGDLNPKTLPGLAEWAAATTLWMRYLPDQPPLEGLGWLVHELQSYELEVTSMKGFARLLRIWSGLNRVINEKVFTVSTLKENCFCWNPLEFFGDANVAILDHKPPQGDQLELALDFTEEMLTKVLNIGPVRSTSYRMIRKDVYLLQNNYEAAKAEVELTLLAPSMVSGILINWAHEHYLEQNHSCVPKDAALAGQLYQKVIAMEDYYCPIAWHSLATINGTSPFKGPESAQEYLQDEDMVALVNAGEKISKELYTRVLSRGQEVAPLLNDLMLDAPGLIERAENLPEDAGDCAWAPTHALVLAAELASPETIHGAVRALEADVENDIAALPFENFVKRLGPDFAEDFLEIAYDCTRPVHLRASVCQGLVYMAFENPGSRNLIVSRFINLLAQESSMKTELADYLAGSLSITNVPKAIEAIDQAEKRQWLMDFNMSEIHLNKSDKPWSLEFLPDAFGCDEYLKTIKKISADWLRSQTT
jgi:SEC-C motif